MHETKNQISGSRRGLVVTVIVVVAVIVAVWLVIMTGALAFVLDPEVEGHSLRGRSSVPIGQ